MAEQSTRTRRRIVVIANETCLGDRLLSELRARRGDDPDTEVILVAPALTPKIKYWMSDEDEAIEAAQKVADESAERLGAAGIPIRAHVGDADPLQALEDAIREYSPDEVVIATHPPDKANWLEEGFVAQAQARSSLPLTHIVVDREHQSSTVVDQEPVTPNAPVHERHTGRDAAFLAVAFFLAIAGTLMSLLFYESDASSWVLWTWVLVLDLGLKLFLMGVIWVMFQRRPRADRLDL